MPLELLAFSTGIATAQPGRGLPQEGPPRVQYSAISSTETRLPEGMFPASLLTERTGSLLVGDPVVGHRSDVERAADGSLRYVQEVAAALPTDEEDERIVDALIAQRTAGLATRPLRRRESGPR